MYVYEYNKHNARFLRFERTEEIIGLSMTRRSITSVFKGERSGTSRRSFLKNA